MAISIKNIIKQSAKFNFVQVIAKMIAIPQSIIVARILMPTEYGVIGFLNLWLLYGSLINPGIFSAGIREIPYYLGRQENDKANEIQNIVISQAQPSHLEVHSLITRF